MFTLVSTWPRVSESVWPTRHFVDFDISCKRGMWRSKDWKKSCSKSLLATFVNSAKTVKGKTKQKKQQYFVQRLRKNPKDGTQSAWGGLLVFSVFAYLLFPEKSWSAFQHLLYRWLLFHNFFTSQWEGLAQQAIHVVIIWCHLVFQSLSSTFKCWYVFTLRKIW